MDWLKQLQKPNYWLLALAGAIATLHLTLLDQADDQNLFSLSLLLWLAIASLLWDKRNDLKLDSGMFSTWLGIFLITIVLLRSLSPAGFHLRISPFVCGFALCLMASGVKHLKQYWKELLILGLLVLYSVFEGILAAIHLPEITAQFSTLNLWLLGFDIYREGVVLVMPTGKVEVLEACSGAEIITLMFYTAVVFLLLFPQKNIHKIVCLIVAPLLGFVINCWRVSLLTLLVNYSDTESFKYWHGEEGSLIFAMLSVLVFGVFCWFFYIRTTSSSSLES